MRKLNKKNGRLWGLICALVLFTGIAVATACSDDEDCKTCKNAATSKTWEACGDELKEAQQLDNVTCN